MDAEIKTDSSSNLPAATEALRLANERLAVATEALRKAEEQAVAGRLALETMHDIRNPLEALGDILYLAQQEAGDCDKVRDFMRLAEEQMTNLRNTANQTLGFARPGARPAAVDLAALSEAAVRIHQRTIREKHIHLVKDFPAGVTAEVQSGALLQVLSNLVTNALDALPTDGTLMLRLRKRKRGVHLIVADNGSGIPPSQSGAIFHPFFTTKAEKGTGLGLAISKKIVEHHRGNIRVRSSVRPGKSGTTFKVFLPGVE